MTCQNKSLVVADRNNTDNKKVVPYTVTRYNPSAHSHIEPGNGCLKRKSYIPALAIPGQNILRDPEALFLFLTQWTVPHGYEGEHYGSMLSHFGFEEDVYGNWFREIGYKDADGTDQKPTTAFCAHMDTACEGVNLILRNINKGIVTTDGRSILGADDRAGMTVLLYMMNQGIPGLYCFFVGEEAGCYGSRKASQDLTRFHKITKMISFDRKGNTSVITRQCGDRTCSDTFAVGMCAQLQRMGLIYRTDPHGLYTDSKEFAWDIPECTNISVGYGEAHTRKEFQSTKFLKRLCVACLGIDWEGLPVERDPDSEFDQWKRNGYHSSSRWWDYLEGNPSYHTGSYNWEEGEYPRSSEEIAVMRQFSNDQHTFDFENPHSAIERIVEDFQNGLPVDAAHLACLVCTSASMTIANMELLMEALQEGCR